MDILLSDELTMLPELVDRQRAEIAGLLDGLTEDEARESLVPSLTTLLGLVKHATFVEKVWFHHRVAGRTREAVGIPDEIDDSFMLDDADTVASVRTAFVAACAHSRTVVEGVSMDDTFEWRDKPVNLRYIYGHMVAELSRHAGHGDILREQVLARRTG